MKKKALSLLLAVVMIVGMIPSVALTAFAETANSVEYRYYDENLKAFDTRFRNCTVITEDDDEWDEGWYVVYGEVTISDRVTVSEDVHLILADGCKLTCEKGIQVETSWSPFEDDASLTIYAQSDDSNPNKGKLKAVGDKNRAGIGSGELVNMFYGDITGDITIHGGYVEACGGTLAAGIGGGYGANGGSVTIYGGEISAYGGKNAAGIGGGLESLYCAGGEGGNVKIYGGNVFAKAGEGASAIGGGCQGDGGEFALYGGYVFADGELYGSSIGGGFEGEGGKTSFYGGTLHYSITIGKGRNCDGSNGSIEVGEGLVLVNDKGNVINEGFNHIPWEEYLIVPRYSFSVLPSGKPITYMEYDDLFGYTESKCNKYTIVGKNTKVWGNGWYYVIDSGTFTDPVTVTGDAHLIISDTNTLKALGGIRVEKGASLSIYSQSEGDRQGKLVVSAPANTAGIGGGNGKDGGTVRIHGCDITVTGGRNAAAIGGGNGANGGTLSLFGGKVTAAAGTGASRAFGAGSGGSDNGTVEVREGFELSDSVSGKTISREDSLVSGWASLLSGTNYILTLVQEAIHANDPVTYMYHGEDLDLFSATQTLYRFIREDSQTLNSGWYVADGTLTLDHPLSVIGDVHLILKDGSSLTVNGFCVNEGYSLSVYAQSEDESGMGVLNSYGEDLYAGIGSAISSNTGDITIHGGRITAQGGRLAAGIGGGFLFGCGNIKIHGGIVNAESTAYGAGIGSGMADYDYSYEYDEYEGDIIELIAYGSNGTIEITGGTVNAVGNGMGAGIGGGEGFDAGTIIISGGTVTAVGGDEGFGIGNGRFEYTIGDTYRDIGEIPGGSVELKDGNVTAIGKQLSPDGVGSIVADTVKVSPATSHTCTSVKENGSDIEGSPFSEEKEISDLLHGLSVTISSDTPHSFTSNIYRDNGDGTHSRKCTECDKYGEPQNHDKITDTYTWSIDNDNCTVTRTCETCSGTILSEYTENISLIEELPGKDCKTMGTKRLRATFENAEPDEITVDTTYGPHTDADNDGWCDICGVFISPCNTVSESTTELTEGEWAVQNNVSLDKALSVSGNVTLYLSDGYTLTATKGIILTEGNTLTIYARPNSDNMGKIVAVGDAGAAGIGGTFNRNAGTLAINGGDITATGGVGAAGIGGGFNGNGGKVTVNGGIVIATAGVGAVSGQGGAGIGGGYNGTNGDIEINNVKKLTASGFRGIGAGQKMTSIGTIHVDSELLMKAGSSEDDAIEVEEIGDDAYITITPDVPVFKFDSVALVLSGELGLNFYTVVNDVEAVKDGYMLFEIGSSDDTQKVYFKDLTAEDDGRYIFRCNVNVLQMADTITASFHYGNMVEGPYTKSVAQYLNNIKDKYRDNAKLVALADSIANYGHYSQIALQEVHGFTLGEDGKYQTMSNYNDITLPVAEDLVAYKATKTGSIDGISGVSRALALDHGTDILLYFTCADGYTPAATVTDKDGNAVACSLTKDESGRYVLTIPNISAHKLGDFYTVSVDGGAMTINISALSYAYSILNSATSSENLKYAVAALYNYYQAAIAYQAAHE